MAAGGVSGKTAAVIGSGFGGLAAAIRLQSAGVQTVLYEARDKPGGRAYVYHDDGYTFDVRQSFYEELTEVYSRTSVNGLKCILGDFNATLHKQLGRALSMASRLQAGAATAAVCAAAYAAWRWRAMRRKAEERRAKKAQKAASVAAAGLGCLFSE